MRAKTISWLLVAVTLMAAGCAAYESIHRGLVPRVLNEEDLAAFDEARALVARQQYEQAIAKLTPLVPVFEAADDSARTASAMFWLAYCHEKQNRPQEAASLYDHVVRRHRGTAAARQAADRLSLLRSRQRP